DGDLLHYVNDTRIALECCPSSNVQTGAVRDLASHPIKFFHDLGLRVSINTDNRLVTDTTVSKELWLAHTQMKLSVSDIKKIILNGFKAAFLPFHIRQQLLRAATRQLAQYGDDGEKIGEAESTPKAAAASRPATAS
ncbi:MAG: adenosine deaminase, partial [Myxococcota bacterium]